MAFHLRLKVSRLKGEFDVNKDILSKYVTENANIPWGTRNAERVLSALLVADNFWDIVSFSCEPLPAVAEALKLLADRGLIEFTDQGVLLTQKGRIFIEEEGVFPLHFHTCPRCDGKTVVIDEFREAFDEFLRIQIDRPEAIREFDQGYVTPETTFARIALADSRGDLRGKEVVVLGDDDLVGVALGLTGLVKSVVVLELDERLVAFEQRIATELGLPLQVIRHDLRKPLTKELLSKFDVFFCDPPETIEAFDAFVGRGIIALKGEGCAGYFGITHVESSYYKWRLLEMKLLQRGLVITDIIHDFNVYMNWEYVDEMLAWDLAPIKQPPIQNWYKSSMVRVEMVEKLEIPNEDLTNRDIYNDPESSTT